MIPLSHSCRQWRGTISMIFFLVTLSVFASAIFAVDARRLPWLGTHVTSPPAHSSSKSRISSPEQLLSPVLGKEHASRNSWLSSLIELRGGEVDRDNDASNDDDDGADADEERYSRQVYTMGARAHGLIRSSTVYVDGPIRSGILWESIKNLALSGVGSIVLIVDDRLDENGTSSNYHVPHLDDLGATYIRGALRELERNDENNDPSAWSSSELVEVLVEFLHRLNPALEVSTVSREAFPGTAAAGGGVLLCADRPHAAQEEWNDAGRDAGLKFVSVDTAGVYGRVFCDFGNGHEIHDIDGETPLVVPLDAVEALEDDDGGRSNSKNPILLVKSVEGERHDVSRDDIIVFRRSDGSGMEGLACRVTRVRTPERIEVEVTMSKGGDEECPSHQKIVDKINAEAVTFCREKQLLKVSFRSLRDATREASHVFAGDSHEPIFTPCDLDKSFDETRKNAVFGSFQALGEFAQEHGRLPTTDDDDAGTFVELASQHAASNDGEEWRDHCDNFLRTSSAKFVPLQAILAAIASQECLKAISGLYNPVQQFLLYDCDEVLVDAEEGEEEQLPPKSAESGLSHILGPKIASRLRNQKLFVVGAGAIGCELLKNLAAMGGGSGSAGGVVVTDMDTIEKSNLSRQLLFRDSDIGKFKSKAAEESMLRMNPSCGVKSHTSKVGDEEDPGPFGSVFWSKKVDVILNALDNMEARLFMDDQCVANRKALIDAGTLGSKGNVQVVVPHQSESYGSSVDPPEPAIPVCTLKNFPYAISHTIQWGRDLFDGLFVRRPRQANQHAGAFSADRIAGVARKLDAELGDEAALEAAKELAEDLQLVFEVADGDAAVRKLAIEWAINLGKELFRDAIAGLLEEHPVDELDEDGELFWSGSRKPPRPLPFSLEGGGDDEDDEIRKNTIEFVRSAARLRYETYAGIPSNARDNLGLVSAEAARAGLAASSRGPNGIEASTTPAKSETVRRRLSPLEVLSERAEGGPGEVRSLAVAEFEKDDDANDHIAFITAASNLRAICYGIAPVDAMETRRVAGKIIPAMITTTALVSALSCLELTKLAREAPLRQHRNAFVNLALPFFAFTAPVPAERYDGVRGRTHTLWDKIEVRESKKAAGSGGITLKRLLRKLRRKACTDDPEAVVVSNISIGPIMVYANFLHEDDDELLNTSIWEVIENAIRSGEEFDEAFSRDGPGTSGGEKDDAKGSSPSAVPASFVDLTVAVEDTETFDEVELPQVRLFRSK